jgi:hypothetical protein
MVQKGLSQELNLGRGRFRLSTANLLPERKDFEGRITSTAKEGSDSHKEREEDMEHESFLLTRRNVASPGRHCEIASCRFQTIMGFCLQIAAVLRLEGSSRGPARKYAIMERGFGNP